jgi:predicted ABC-type ATPase
VTRPKLFVIAGPNSAGKSTLHKQKTVAELLKDLPVVNPDNIAFQIDPERRDTEAVQLQAGQTALRERQANLAARKSHIVETTLSGHSEIKFMRQAAKTGFEVNLVFVGVREPGLSRRRVSERIMDGGHSVPPDAIERRYPRSMANLAKALEIADTAKVFDNSGRHYVLLLDRDRKQINHLAPELPEWATKAIPAKFLDQNETTRDQSMDAALAYQPALVPAAVLSDRLSSRELKTRLDNSAEVAESLQRLEATAKTVFAEWRPIVDTVKSSAISGNDGEQLVATLNDQPNRLGQLAGRGGLFPSKERRGAIANRPLLAAAARHHIRLVTSIRKNAEQEKYERTRRAKIEINPPSHELTEAIADKKALSGKLENELHQLLSAFQERFAYDLPALRNARDLKSLAIKTGLSTGQLTEARQVLLQLDKGAAQEIVREKNAEQSLGR